MLPCNDRCSACHPRQASSLHCKLVLPTTAPQPRHHRMSLVHYTSFIGYSTYIYVAETQVHFHFRRIKTFLPSHSSDPGIASQTASPPSSRMKYGAISIILHKDGRLQHLPLLFLVVKFAEDPWCLRLYVHCQLRAAVTMRVMSDPRSHPTRPLKRNSRPTQSCESIPTPMGVAQ